MCIRILIFQAHHLLHVSYAFVISIFVITTSSNFYAPAWWQDPFHRTFLMTTTVVSPKGHNKKRVVGLCRESLPGGSNTVSYSDVSGFVPRSADYLSGLSFL